MIRRLAAVTVAATLVALPLVSSQPAASRADAPQGAHGIGDPYFPLDGNGGIDVLSYDIHGRYRFGEGRLSGWTRVTLQTTEALSSFNLDFLLPVTRVTIGGRDIDFHQNRRHELVVDHDSTAGEVVRLVVQYDGKPGKYAYDGEANWLASEHEVVTMNQPHMAPWWFPSNDHPLDKARMKVSITVPKAEKVISNGRQVSRKVHGRLATTTWRADEPMVPYLAFFAAGRFDIARGSHDGLPWLVAVSKRLPTASRTEAMALMKRTPELLEWLQRRLGDYPFSTTGGLATSLNSGFALENQTRPTYSPWSLDVSTVVHELAHQWFGDSVAVAAWRDIWLNEGPATFMEWLHAEKNGGPSAERAMRDLYQADADDQLWNLRVAAPCSSHQGCATRIFDERVYQRGAMTMQALRNRIGEGALWDLLRRWVSDGEGGNGSTAQFQALAEEVSGQDLDGFFDAWVRSTDKPADTVANGLG